MGLVTILSLDYIWRSVALSFHQTYFTKQANCICLSTLGSHTPHTVKFYIFYISVLLCCNMKITSIPLHASIISLLSKITNHHLKPNTIAPSGTIFAVVDSIGCQTYPILMLARKYQSLKLSWFWHTFLSGWPYRDKPFRKIKRK